jgi:DnaD/phage-associated family protein
VPEAFFSEVMPGIDSLAELKAVLVALRRIRRRKGNVRWVTASEVVAAPELGDLGLAAQDGDRAGAVLRALDMAAGRGVLVAVGLQGPEGAADTAYFVNDREGRRAAELVRTGAFSIGSLPVQAPVQGGAADKPAPGIFRLYEDVIGPIPGAELADELAAAERDYPAQWVEEAFREAAAQNVRRWAYVRAILARWREEGRNEDGTTQRRSAQDRYRAGKYGRVVRWK